MSKRRKRSGGGAAAAIRSWLVFDAHELAWIVLAVGGVLLFAYVTGA
jgi:hypothetical protein